MRRCSAFFRWLAIPAVLLATTSPPALAGWPHDTWTNVPVCTAAGDQVAPLAVNDGSGGMLVAWLDSRSGNADLYAQHLRSDGTAMWTSGGLAVSTGSGVPASVRMVADNAGGCFLVWSEDRGSGTLADIYAQHLTSAGLRSWGTNGVAVCTAAGAQVTPDAVASYDGHRTLSFFVAWSDARSDSGDIYVQRLTSTGIAWAANGLAMCTLTGTQAKPVICADAGTGAIVAWTSTASGSTPRLRAQRVISSGIMQWTQNGVYLTSYTWPQRNPSIAADGAGGAVVACEGYPSSSTGWDIFAQRIDGTGALLWGVGLPVCSTGASQLTPAVQVVPGNAMSVFAWEDHRNSKTGVYVQVANTSGSTLLATNGVAVTGSAGSQLSYCARLYSSQLYVSWNEVTGDVSDAYVQKISTAGALLWGANGMAVCEARGAQVTPVCAPGSGACLVAWDDSRSGTDHDVYAQRIDPTGVLGAPQPAIVGARDVPGDQGGHVRVDWSASDRDTDPGYMVGTYLVLRWAPGGTRWDTLATLPAVGLPQYSCVAATTVDSTAGSNPRSAFEVIARTADGQMSWWSAPDSGYSVDNLAPPAPSSFAARADGGHAVLSWSASPGSDVTGYRVERSTTAEFAPSSTGLVGETPGTEIVDATPERWYRLTALDAHGNASPAARTSLEGAARSGSTTPSNWPSTPSGVALGALNSDIQMYPAICSDGAGGAIAAWTEEFWINPELTQVTYQIRAQRVNRQGVVQWSASGVPVLDTYDYDLYQNNPVLVPDGAGGAIAVWRHHDESSSHDSLKAQRFDANGARSWGKYGVLVAPHAATYPMVACSDGAGGVIVVWQRTGNAVYSQRLSASGVPLWASGGVVVCADALVMAPVAVATDDAHGAYVVFRYSSGLRAQHLDAAGTARWAADGEWICGATGGSKSLPDVCADGSGGAVLVWVDTRRGYGYYDLYAQRIDDASRSWWGASGALLSAWAAGTTPKVVPDGSGGGVVGFGAYAQRVTGGGVAQWGANGVTLASGTGTRAGTSVVGDGSGGAIFAWHDTRGGDRDLYMRRVDGDGVVLGVANGRLVCGGAMDQSEPALCPDGAGSAIVAFRFGYQQSYGTVTTIMAERIDRFDALGDPAPRLNGVQDVSHDEGGAVLAGWYASPIDVMSSPAVASYWVWRQVPAAVALTAISAGARWADAPRAGLDTASPVRAPAYGRLFTTTRVDAATFYWEYVHAVPATGAVYYVDTLSTPSTRSTGLANPWTIVMVQARAASGPGWWNSTPDSAVAVDNMAPPSPSPFTATYSGGTSTLAWGASGVADFRSYRLHRGSSTTFVPGDSNLVVEKATTGYVDAAGAPYVYKLAAVDIHGNVGPYATVVPSGTGDVPDLATLRFALDRVGPNPSTAARAQVEYSLPDAARARLELLDVCGRRVRSLDVGALGAGHHTLSLAGELVLRPGIYVVRLSRNGEVRTRRITILE